MKHATRPASRRGFLMASGTAAAIGAAAVATKSPTTSSPTPSSAIDAASESTGSGYRLTEHIQRYYRTTRI